MGNESQSIVPRTKGLLRYFMVALDMTLKTIFIFLQVRYTGFFKYICCLDLEYISFNSCICLFIVQDLIYRTHYVIFRSKYVLLAYTIHMYVYHYFAVF